MMTDVRLDMPAEKQIHQQYYSPGAPVFIPAATKSSSFTSLPLAYDEKRAPSKKLRLVATCMFTALALLAAAAIATFVIYTRPPTAIYKRNYGATRAPVRSSRLDTDVQSVDEDENIANFVDSAPSGFRHRVDFVGDDELAEPAIGQPSPTLVLPASLTPKEREDALKSILDDLASQVVVDESEEQMRGPPGAAEFSIGSVDTGAQEPDESFYNPTDIELEPADTLADFLPDPPSGAWEDAVTPPPLPPHLRERIAFQESFKPSDIEWKGPMDATWFSIDDGSIDVLADDSPSSRTTIIDAPWLGDGCTIESVEGAEERVVGTNCESLWKPYHYDLYERSSAEDWQYIDMKKGPRTHVWPGAGPFRKIQIQNRQDPMLANGPICLDLPPKPLGYSGVEPDELDCARYLQRAEGYGDDLEYPEVADSSSEWIEGKWWFIWRMPRV